MFSFCYAKNLNYLERTVFPSPCILQHYTKFDTCTISMLEKLSGLGSFGTIVGHLVCCQVILPTSSRGLNLPSMVQCIAFTFLGCWALIILPLISCFQQGDHPILLDAVTRSQVL
jgi:hypothetical protein